MLTLDGSEGEAGGQILRSALTLSLVTGQPFRLIRIRANRSKPGLRPQHLAAVKAAASLCGAELQGAEVDSRDLTFRPGQVVCGDLQIEIGTAGATSLVLQTLQPALAMKSAIPVRVSLTGGTFNPHAPSFPFLENTYVPHLRRLGQRLSLAMPRSGFYPRGGGVLEAWIEPGAPKPLVLTDRGALKGVRGIAGATRLPEHVASRMSQRVLQLLEPKGIEPAMSRVEWPGPAPGAALALVAEHDYSIATFVAIGERGKPAETLAEEAAAELLEYLDAPGAVDAHSADQLVLPLALAQGASIFTVASVTEHLRTNIAVVRAFLGREIRIEEPEASEEGPGPPARVLIL